MELNELYLQTLKNTLIDLHRCNGYWYKPLVKFRTFQLVKVRKINQQKRINGEDWPMNAESMIGLKRMNNIEYLIQKIIDNKIPGDLLEAGVWKGGASIFMKANLLVHGSNKELYVCDSFEGLPKPSLEEDAGDIHHTLKFLAVSRDEVVENFARYGLLDNKIHFVKGWFKDTMPQLKENRFSLIRADGDMYESTMPVLNLYDSLSPGGYIIIDDYALSNCKQAVHDFREQNNITDRIIHIDNMSVYWQKT